MPAPVALLGPESAPESMTVCKLVLLRLRLSSTAGNLATSASGAVRTSVGAVNVPGPTCTTAPGGADLSALSRLAHAAAGEVPALVSAPVLLTKYVGARELAGGMFSARVSIEPVRTAEPPMPSGSLRVTRTW